MTEPNPNLPLKDHRCGRCRFTSTHTHADGPEKFMVVCRRFPPIRMGRESAYNERLTSRANDTGWPVVLWDDWCGEWERRLHEDPDS